MRDKGFSLIETLVAVALLGIMLYLYMILSQNINGLKTQMVGQQQIQGIEFEMAHLLSDSKTCLDTFEGVKVPDLPEMGRVEEIVSGENVIYSSGKKLFNNLKYLGSSISDPIEIGEQTFRATLTNYYEKNKIKMARQSQITFEASDDRVITFCRASGGSRPGECQSSQGVPSIGGWECDGNKKPHFKKKMWRDDYCDVSWQAKFNTSPGKNPSYHCRLKVNSYGYYGITCTSDEKSTLKDPWRTAHFTQLPGLSELPRNPQKIIDKIDEFEKWPDRPELWQGLHAAGGECTLQKGGEEIQQTGFFRQVRYNVDTGMWQLWIYRREVMPICEDIDKHNFVYCEAGGYDKIKTDSQEAI